MTDHVANEDDIQNLFADKAYWHKVHQAARDIALRGYEKQRVPDFPLRLRLIRTLFRLNDDFWTGRVIAWSLFGLDEADASSRFNKFKTATTKLDETEASLIACFINYLLDDPHPKDGTKRPSDRQLLDVSQWILKGIQTDPDRIMAHDIAGDLFAFARKLIALAKREAELDGEPMDAAILAYSHDQLMFALLSPIERASWTSRLIVQHPRTRYAGVDRPRFGAEQRVGTDPRLWVPIDLTVGQPIEYGLSRKLAEPSKGWLVTIRDPRPVINGRRASLGPWLWEAGWENTIRWTSSPFVLPAETEIAAPASEKNVVLDVPGLFRTFMFVEPLYSVAISECLGTSQGQTLDHLAYFRLADLLAETKVSDSIEVFTGSYLVS